MTELVVGRIVRAEPHPGARAPSYLLTVDLGGLGTRETTLPASDHSAQELEGRQVVCSVDGDDTVVLAAHTHERGLVLLAPEHDVPAGTAVA